MRKQISRSVYFFVISFLLISLTFGSITVSNVHAGSATSKAPVSPFPTLEKTKKPTRTPGTPSVTPSSTSTPLTGLTFSGWDHGCTATPYITCSASVTSTHTDPYRWDFDITFTYGDNSDFFGSTFSLDLHFNSGVFQQEVPIWWNMYPIVNEVMPTRSIDVFYPVSDLPSMSYPSGAWTIEPVPSPWDGFTIHFDRVTGEEEVLVRTDTWHFTIATYPNIATPTITPTNTYTPTATSTPTLTVTPLSYGNGYCWVSGPSWATYTVDYLIETSGPYAIPLDWVSSIEAAAATWTNVTPSHFSLIHQSESDNPIKYKVPDNPFYLAVSYLPPPNAPIDIQFIIINPNYPWSTNNNPPPNDPTYNVQSVVTHEFGHWLFLDDIYDSANCDHVTMYYSIASGETKKITLAQPDIDGINWQYP